MKTLRVIAAVVMIALLGGSASAAADVASKSGIRVVSAGHQIQYPDRLVFHLEAEADATITEIRLFYTLGGRSVQTYGYPDFTPGRRVASDFSIRTSGASYIPTGVDVEYYYRITDADRNTLETARSSFEYRDPRYRWNKLTRGDLTVLWHDISRRRVERLTADVVERLEEVKSVFGLGEVEPMKAVIVNSRREARSAFPFPSEAARRGHFFAGFAFSEYSLFVMQGLSADTMVHEAAHLLLDQAVDSPLARVPAWLNEGLAMQFEDGAIAYSAAVRSAARANRLLKLNHMGSVPGESRDISVFYGQAWSIVDYMMDNYGPERMGALLAALDSGERFDQAFQTAYGFTPDDLERAWRAGLLGASVAPPRPGPAIQAAASESDVRSRVPDSPPAVSDLRDDSESRIPDSPPAAGAPLPASPPGPSVVGTAAFISGTAAVAMVVVLWRWIWQRLHRPTPENGVHET